MRRNRRMSGVLHCDPEKGPQRWNQRWYKEASQGRTAILQSWRNRTRIDK